MAPWLGVAGKYTPISNEPFSIVSRRRPFASALNCSGSLSLVQMIRPPSADLHPGVRWQLTVEFGQSCAAGGIGGLHHGHMRNGKAELACALDQAAQIGIEQFGLAQGLLAHALAMVVAQFLLQVGQHPDSRQCGGENQQLGGSSDCL
jgi:hypothetical protein